MPSLVISHLNANQKFYHCWHGEFNDTKDPQLWE